MLHSATRHCRPACPGVPHAMRPGAIGDAAEGTAAAAPRGPDDKRHLRPLTCSYLYNNCSNAMKSSIEVNITATQGVAAADNITLHAEARTGALSMRRGLAATCARCIQPACPAQQLHARRMWAQQQAAPQKHHHAPALLAWWAGLGWGLHPRRLYPPPPPFPSPLGDDVCRHLCVWRPLSRLA